MKGILGEKVGMTAVFREDGGQLPVTVVRTGGTTVVGKRTEERDGYSALILGFGEQNAKRVGKPLEGFFEKQGVVEERDGKRFVKRHLRELRLPAEQVAEYEVGAELALDTLFKAGDRVDVVGTSKGRGFTGVMKRHNFKGTKASHGVHEYFRHGGSIGSNTSPARVFKNRKMPGQHGNKRTTVQNIEVVAVMAEEKVLLLRGGLPGANGGLLMVKEAIKHRH
ncbi:MAG: 50S ribosomal protein L3 [Myxococcales bacterium]|nr:50S ribosomal protein L3 [Myxococcales bacterium]